MTTHRSISVPVRSAVCAACVTLASAAAFVPCASAGAQVDELRSGARVRLRAPGLLPGEVDGIILDRRGDTLVFAVRAHGRTRVPLARVTAASVYRGRSREAGLRKGLRRGALAGAGFGVVDAALSDCVGAHCDGLRRAGGVLVFTGVGAGVGALVGSALGAEQWDRLSLPTPRTIASVPDVR